MEDDQITTVEDLAAALDDSEGQATEAPGAEHEGAQAESQGNPEAGAEQIADEAESDAEAAEDDAGQATEAPADDWVIKWKAHDGSDIEAPISELKQGYLRHADYTQKAQQLGEERKQASEQVAQQMQQVQQMTHEQARLMGLADELATYARADWAALFQQDPVQASQLQAQWKQTEVQAQQLAQGLLLKSQQLQLQACERHQQASFEALTRLQAEIPGFGDGHLKAMRDTGLAHGFTDEELSQVADARTLKVLHEAAQWRALQAKKPAAQRKVQAAPPRASKPGAAGVPPSKSEAAWKQMTARRDVDSLAAFLAASES
jgi:hypothetical protein